MDMKLVFVALPKADSGRLFFYLIDSSQEGQGTGHADGVTRLSTLHAHQLHCVHAAGGVRAQCGVTQGKNAGGGVLVKVETNQEQLFIHHLPTRGHR